MAISIILETYSSFACEFCEILAEQMGFSKLFTIWIEMDYPHHPAELSATCETEEWRKEDLSTCAEIMIPNSIEQKNVGS